MKHKKFIFSILFFLLIVVGCSLGLFSPALNIYSKNIANPRTSDGEITIITPENKTYIEQDTGYFLATFGFENDLDGTIPEEWVEIKDNPLMQNEIIAQIDGHKKVLHMDKGNTYGDNNNMYQNFTIVKEYGTIEFWGRTTDETQEASWHLKSGGFNEFSIVSMRIMDSEFQFRNSSGWFPVPLAATADQWYHIKLQFECGTGNNYGLDQYYWKMYVDGIEFGDFQMISSHSNVSHFLIHQNWRYDNFHIYTDAVSYSWDMGYSLGDNLKEGLLLSYDNISTLDWQGYSLDGQANRTILGNFTLPMPSDGVHNIQVFGNDTMSTMYESDLRYFTVSTAPPVISINLPIDSQVIGITAPNYDLSITGPYESIWYTFEGGANYSASGLTGTIDQTAWSALLDGIIAIDFYANNSAGMIGTAQVQVFKDSSVVEPQPAIPGYNIFLVLGVLSVITTIILRKRLKS